MKKFLSGLLALVMLFGVIGPVGAVYAQDNKDTEVQEALLAEELKFYFEEVGHFNEDNEYIVTNPELLEDRIENGDEVAKDLYDLYLANREIQPYGAVDYGKCIIRDYFGMWVDLFNGNLFDLFVGHIKDQAWGAAAKIVLKVAGKSTSNANTLAAAAQLAVSAYNCRGSL